MELDLTNSPTEPMIKAARTHGLPPDREAVFLLWVGNECFEGREVENFTVLTARAKQLTQMFMNQDKPCAP